MITCPECGKENPIDAAVCAYCGAEITLGDCFIKTTLCAFPKKLGPSIFIRELNNGKIYFRSRLAFPIGSILITDIGKAVLTVAKKNIESIDNIHAKSGGLSEPYGWRINIILSNCKILMKKILDDKTSLDPKDICIIIQFEGNAELSKRFTEKIIQNLDKKPWKGANWDKFTQFTGMARKRVVSDWNNILSGKFEEIDDIDKLIAKLRHGSQKEQINAAKYLGEIKNKKAVVPLGERLSSGIDDLTAKHVINALVKIGDTRAIEYLREAQSQYPEKIKKRILEALKKIGATQHKKSLQHCPSCGREIKPDWKACPYCKTRLKKVCPSCNKPIESDWAVCPHCGHDLRTTCPSCGSEVRAGWTTCPYCKTSLE